ncbi:MAG: M50 family metallopeptidase [Patescibacteria group bacterium]
MGVLIFIIVLVVLIVAHELGHFFAAKAAGMKVEEFGIGYPPRAMTIAKRGDTEYTLNWLPFGGFVKIFGEDESEETHGEKSRSFVSKPRIVQAGVLVAGIAMNLLFAWVLLSLTLALGVPRALSPEEAALAPDAKLIIANVLPGSPAEEAGLMRGDVLLSASNNGDSFSESDSAAFTTFIAAQDGKEVLLSVERNGEVMERSATPKQGVAPSDPERYALGVGVGTIGTMPVSVLEAPIEGAKITWEVTKQTAVGLLGFFGSVFTLTADLSQVSGPVGIAGAVGSASETGFASLLSLTAIISVNLALINILPIPALDGGRLLFVAIEAVIRRPIPKGVAAAVNTAGFLFLILLMFVITASDIFKIVGT